MSLKNQWLFNIAMVCISWFILPLVGKRSIKRYLPASILAILLTCFDLQIGKQRRWWSFYNKPQSTISNEFPFLIGPMLMMSLLSLKWTYGNLKKFIMLNALFQVIFTFPLTRLFTKLKIYRLVWLNEFQFFLYFFYKAFFLYGCQYLFELFGFTTMNRKETTPPINKHLHAPQDDDRKEIGTKLKGGGYSNGIQ